MCGNEFRCCGPAKLLRSHGLNWKKILLSYEINPITLAWHHMTLKGNDSLHTQVSSTSRNLKHATLC